MAEKIEPEPGSCWLVVVTVGEVVAAVVCVVVAEGVVKLLGPWIP